MHDLNTMLWLKLISVVKWAPPPHPHPQPPTRNPNLNPTTTTSATMWLSVRNTSGIEISKILVICIRVSNHYEMSPETSQPY